MKSLVFLLALATGVAWADMLPDPTRPPASFGSQQSQTADGAAEEALRLQSVFLPKQGRPTAIIGGRTVQLGDRVGDGRLVRLTESEAVIEGGQGILRLRLTPEVEWVGVAVNKGGKKSPGKTKERE